MFGFNVIFEIVGIFSVWFVFTVSTLPIRWMAVLAVNLEHLGCNNIYKQQSQHMVDKMYIYSDTYKLSTVYYVLIVNRMVSSHVHSQCIPRGYIFTAFRTIVAPRNYMIWFNVVFHVSSMRWRIATVCAMPFPHDWVTSLVRINFVHLGRNNIYNKYIIYLIFIQCYMPR